MTVDFRVFDTHVVHLYYSTIIYNRTIGIPKNEASVIFRKLLWLSVRNAQSLKITQSKANGRKLSWPFGWDLDEKTYT